MPLLVSSKAKPEALRKKAPVTPPALQAIAGKCTLKTYKSLQSIPSFEIQDDFIAYASPDSTYAVTRRLIDGAKNEILIGIYEFSAEYVKQLLLNAKQRGVKISIMLDVHLHQEQDLMDELTEIGFTMVPAPSCSSKVIHYFSVSHEKVIIIDGIWCLVQSGNYSNNSIPFNEKDGGDPAHFVTGNRDMGVAIKSAELCTFFSELLDRDMKLELDAVAAEVEVVEIEALPDPKLVEAVPETLPVKFFPSKTFTPGRPIRVTPILTPDNYMDVIPELLASAKKSILIENQYIRSLQDHVIKLLEAIAEAKGKNSALDVRIILGKLFGEKDVPKEEENIATLKEKYGLLLDANIRYIDTSRFVHCHNKLIIVDEAQVLISSENWSETAVFTNREAGVVMDFPEIAKYYSEIFESDWSTAQKQIPSPGKGSIEPEELAKGNYLTVAIGDYIEV